MLFKFFNKKKTLANLQYFCFALVEHCNLNCKYCDHFVPLAEEKFADISKLENEFIELSKIIFVNSIGIMGGEPLLHPQINECLIMMRKVFPKTFLTIYTNGILLASLPDTFWETCKNNEIRIRISKYPLNINFKNVFEKAKKFGVVVEFYGSYSNNSKLMYKLSLDLTGSQNKEEMHDICWKNKGFCTFFSDGKLYKCPTIGKINNFNNYFHTNLKVMPDDYIEISKIRKKSDLYKYFNKPSSFCRYCNLKNNKENLEFEMSNKDIKEWTD